MPSCHAMPRPGPCHAKTRSMPCQDQVHVMPRPGPCHAKTRSMPCQDQVQAMPRPGPCHAETRSMPCQDPVQAMPRPGPCHAKTRSMSRFFSGFQTFWTSLTLHLCILASLHLCILGQPPGGYQPPSRSCCPSMCAPDCALLKCATALHGVTVTTWFNHGDIHRSLLPFTSDIMRQIGSPPGLYGFSTFALLKLLPLDVQVNILPAWYGKTKPLTHLIDDDDVNRAPPVMKEE